MTWLKRFIPLLAFVLPSFLWAKGEPVQKGLYDFSKGLDSYHSSLSLPDGYVQAALNGFFDARAPFEKRQGYTLAFSSKQYSFQNTWTYTDPTNTTWIIVRASDTLIANNLSGSASVKIATVSVNNLVGETNAFGNAYFVDQSQGVYYWNGSSVTFVAGSPFGSIITSFHNRLWVSGVAVPYGNQLYGSTLYNGSIWTPNVNPNDPVQLTVGIQDNFDNITALYVYLDTLYAFKHYATYGLYGFDQTSFQISEITQECGCIDGGTVQTFGGDLKFVSLRGVEDFNGYTCNRISDPVKNLVDPAIYQGGFSQQSWVQSQTADWKAGTLNNLNTAIASPALVLSTYSATDTLIDTASVPDYSFENSSNQGWTYSGFSQITSVTGDDCTITPYDGSYFASAQGNNYNPVFSIIDAHTSGQLYSVNFQSDPTCTWTAHTVTPINADIGKAVTLKFVNGAGSTLISTRPFVLEGPITFYDNADTKVIPNSITAIDFVTGGFNLSISTTSYSYVSPVFNLGFLGYVDVTSLGYNTALSTIPVFSLESSPNGTSSWTVLTGTTNASVLATGSYVQYVATMTPASQMNSLSFVATASSGSFESQIHNIASINSWGNFSVSDVLNGGNIVFSMCSSTNSNMGTPESCATQATNSQITVSTGTYVQWFATFTVTAATQAPTLNSGTVQWFTGSRSVPMASTIWDNRYWLSLTTSTADSGNDAILVLSRSGVWSLLDIHAGGLTQTRGSLYHSDSLPTGNVYLDNQGYSDNGNPINAYLKTKDYVLVDLAQDAVLQAIYPTFTDQSNANISLSYFMDRNSTPFTLSSVNQSEYLYASSLKLPFGAGVPNNQVFGETISFMIQQNDSNPMQFYGMNTLFSPREIQ